MLIQEVCKKFICLILSISLVITSLPLHAYNRHYLAPPGSRESFRFELGNSKIINDIIALIGQKSKITYYSEDIAMKISTLVCQLSAEDVLRAAEFLVNSLYDVSWEPCGINHNFTKAFSLIFQNKPDLRDQLIKLMADALKKNPGNQALAESIKLVIETSFLDDPEKVRFFVMELWCALKESCPLLSQDSLLELFHRCYAMWYDILEPEQFWFEDMNPRQLPIEITSKQNQRIILKPYSKIHYFIFVENHPLPIGWALLSYSQQKNIIRMYIVIHEREDCRHGVGHAITEYMIGLLNKTQTYPGYVVLYFPSTPAHVNLFLTCKKENIFSRVEFAISELLYTGEISGWDKPSNFIVHGADTPCWRELKDQDSVIFTALTPEKHIFIRGIIKSRETDLSSGVHVASEALNSSQ